MNYQWSPTAGLPNTSNTEVTWFSTIGEDQRRKLVVRHDSKTRRLVRRERANYSRIWAKAKREGVV